MMLKGLIILDGPDGTGKSYLAAALKKKIESLGSVAVVHHSKPIEGSDCWEVHSQELLTYVHSAFVMKKVVIMDRLFMSEGVYGSIYRGGSVYPYAVRHIDRLLHRFRALRVICAPPVDITVAQHEKLKEQRTEMYDDITAVATRYRLLWDGLDPAFKGAAGIDKREDYLQWLTLTGGVQDRAGWYHYDFTLDGVDINGYCDFLINELQQEQKSALPFTLDAVRFTHTGFAQTGAVLLVGDELAGPNRLSIPFYANSASSLYLAKTLHALEVDESKLVIANINDPGGAQQVFELKQSVNFSKIIALGRMAERSLLHHNLKFDIAVRHPQHARRFTSKDNSYQEELRAALDGNAGVKRA